MSVPLPRYYSLLRVAASPARPKLPFLALSHPSKSSLSARSRGRPHIRYNSAIASSTSISSTPSAVIDPSKNALPTATIPSHLPQTIYTAPLALPFKYLKLFSVSSLALSTALSPFIFILESSLPMGGRVFLAGVAISTTTLSTLLISYFTSPYVTRITLQPPSHPSLDHSLTPSTSNPTPTYSSTTSPPTIPFTHTLTTLNIWGKRRLTKITSTESLEGSDRGMTTWTLRETPSPTDIAETPGQTVSSTSTKQKDKILAWTEDSRGRELGRWVLTSEGRGLQKGRGLVRYFQVHVEMLKGGI